MVYNKKNDLTALLNEDLAAYYWMGYLLADGTFLKSKIVKVLAYGDDMGHLNLLAKTLKTNVNVYENKSGFKLSQYGQISCQDTELVGKLVTKFDIKDAKTYNPPDMRSYLDMFSEDKLVALTIGFIDGDGNISKRRKTGIRLQIKNHISWFDNLSVMNYILHSFASITPNNKVVVDKSGYAVLGVQRKEMIQALKNFILANNIPVNSRKWNIVISQI